MRAAVRWIFGKHSAASELDMSVSKLLDLLSEFGVPAPLNYDAHLEGLESIETGDISEVK